MSLMTEGLQQESNCNIKAPENPQEMGRKLDSISSTVHCTILPRTKVKEKFLLCF